MGQLLNAAMVTRPERSSQRVVMLTLLALVTALAVLAMLAAQGAWLPEPAGERHSAPAVPCWVTLGPLRAVTEDGSALHLRLALNACESGSQDVINARRSDLEAIVRVVVAEHRREELEGAPGIQHLCEVLKLRLGAYVQETGAPTLHDLIVDQFVLRRI